MMIILLIVGVIGLFAAVLYGMTRRAGRLRRLVMLPGSSSVPPTRDVASTQNMVDVTPRGTSMKV
jgi:hypothetical protein